MARTSQSTLRATLWLVVAAAAVLPLAAAAGCKCGGSKNDGGMDGGKLDSAVGSDSAPLDGGVELTQCERVCNHAGACGLVGIAGAACGGFCARADAGVLACLDAAAAEANCDAALMCLTDAPVPPECGPICTFGDMCLFPGICDATCALVNDATRNCAEMAATTMDCTLFGACLIDPATAATCSDVCTFAVDTCGQVIPFGAPGCVAACGSGLIPEVIVSCYQVASFLGSCDAANACGSLIGVPPPGTDSGVPGTDGGGGNDASGTDAASTDAAGTDATI